MGTNGANIHPSNSHVKILVAEDSATQAERLRHILEQGGYEVDVASDGRQALEMAPRFRPALIISDVVMPEMDGYELSRRIKADADLRDIPVILVTTMSDPQDVIHGLECGADNFVLKPYDESYLLGRVRHMLINREMRRVEEVRVGVEIYFDGQRYFITADRLQILNLLLSTYDAAMQRNKELSHAHEELREINTALGEANRRLEQEIREREQAERTVRELNENLERLVVERTAELRESEERFRQLAEHSSEGFWFTQLNPVRILYVSPAVEKVWGLPAENFYQDESIWFKAIHPEDQPRVHAAWEACAGGQSPHYEEEYRVIQPDGSVRWVLDSGTPIRNEAGEIVRLSGLARDVTERRQLEAQFLQAQKMESVGRLAGGIAHDFNNLLTVIINTAELAAMELREGDLLREELATIRDAGARAAALTKQLLAFSRTQVLEPANVNLNTVVVNTEALLRRVIGEDIDLSISLAKDLASVKVDPGQIEQVILNLAINSRDAMPNGGKLTFETRNVTLDEAYAKIHAAVQPGPYVMLAISDTGIGMDEATQRKMFEPFFTTKGPGKGTGLGLATAYGIITQSGGNISVHSEVGQGTTMTIYLPRIEGVARARPAAQTKTAARGIETILVVEDEPAIRRMVQRVLAVAGYTVLTAASGEEALRLFERQNGPIHLMMTDLVMPGMSGQELSKRIAVSHPETKILYTSGYTDDAAMNRGTRGESVHFIGKPYAMTALTGKVRAVLDS